MPEPSKTVLIIGAGPAGLTAALELLRRTDYRPVVFELEHQVGGISRTVQHNGNRMDIGGHRFFSKSDWVMDWWQKILPYAGDDAAHDTISYQNKSRKIDLQQAAPENEENIMLLRPRLSRIYFLKKFFDYPVKLNLNTIANLGLIRIMRIGFSYLRVKIFPPKKIDNLEQFFISRFGVELYKSFFKEYSEKVWGVKCTEISADWGAQRIKGLSITGALLHALKQLLPKRRKGVSQKDTSTSLIEQFLYPKYGPGQMWETVAEQVTAKGGEVRLNMEVTGLVLEGNSIKELTVRNLATGEESAHRGDHVISTMPVKDLINAMSPKPPKRVLDTANGLIYRDFMTAGVLVKKFRKSKYTAPDATNMLPDNWIYIHEPDVKVGRLQIFNNWSPFLVRDAHTVWLGMEYFCNEDDELWRMPDAEFLEFAVDELERIGLADKADVLDTTVLRVKKAYPAYFGSYGQFDEIRRHVDAIDNLFLVGRNGMHRYNNQDHSMLTAKLAVEAIADGNADGSAIWDVNIDDEYHES